MTNLKCTHKSLLATVLALFCFIFVGCSSGDDAPAPSGKNAKITFSVSEQFSKAEGDYFKLDVSGGLADGTFIDWKINGETEVGVLATVNSDDVDGGKDIIIESAESFYSGHLSIGGFEFGETPFTITYKIEVNGNIIDEQTVELEKDDEPFSKTYKL